MMPLVTGVFLHVLADTLGSGGGDHIHPSHSMMPLVVGVFLHVLADTLGSVGVIISTLLIL